VGLFDQGGVVVIEVGKYWFNMKFGKISTATYTPPKYTIARLLGGVPLVRLRCAPPSYKPRSRDRADCVARRAFHDYSAKENGECGSYLCRSYARLQHTHSSRQHISCASSRSCRHSYMGFMVSASIAQRLQAILRRVRSVHPTMGDSWVYG
jgi:hypothetical protein